MFIIDFFRDEGWIYAYNDAFCQWRDDYEIFKTTRDTYGIAPNQVVIRVTARRLYTLYKKWFKENNPHSKAVKSKTFWEQLEDLGISREEHVYMTRVEPKRQKVVAHLVHSEIKGVVMKRFPSFQWVDWATEEEGVRVSMEKLCGNQKN